MKKLILFFSDLLFVFIYLFLFYNIVLVLPYIDMNPPLVFTCSPSWTRLHLLPHTIPLGHPSAPALRILYHASNLGFLISPCYSLELCIQMLFLSFSPLLFGSLLSTAIYKASSDSHFDFLHFFSMGMVLIPVSYTMSQTSVHSSSGTQSIRFRPLNLFLTSTV